MLSNDSLSSQMALLSSTSYATVGGSKIEMLSHTNYFSWAPRAKAILKKERMWKYVDPVKKEANTKLAGEDLEKYKDSLNYLGLLITDEVLQDLKHLETAPAVWTFLKEKYTKTMANMQGLYLQ